jgi:hypothetical protein
VRYEGENEYLPGVQIPPFSRCEVHWPITVTGEIITLVYLPYYGPPEEKRRIAAEIERSFNWQDGVGAEAPSRAVAAEASFTEEQKQRWHVGDPLPLGDMIGVIIEERGGPVMFGLESITAPVTFRLEANKTAPDDAPGLIDGTATLVQGEAFTRDGSPPGRQSPLKLVFPSTGADRGTCTVALPKGFRYTVTFDDDLVHSGPATAACSPSLSPITIHLRRKVCELLFRTERDGVPVGAHIQVLDSEREIVFEADTTAEADCEVSHVFTDLQWRKNVHVRARPLDASDERYGDLVTVQFTPSTIPTTVRVRVPPILPRLW